MNLQAWLYNNIHRIPNWPTADTGDPLDTENLTLIAVTSRGVDFCCGGDWQTPQWLLLREDLSVEVVVGELERMVGLEVELPRWMR